MTLRNYRHNIEGGLICQIRRRLRRTCATPALSAGTPGIGARPTPHATPEVGGTVPSSPAEVLVNFSEPLEAAFSTLIVRDAVGKRVDKADAHLDPTTARRCMFLYRR